jgi:hypothetical protein
MRIRSVLAIFLVWTLSSGISSFCSDLALVHAKIYPSPTEPPIENGAILVHAGRILAVGPTATIKIPRHAAVIDCNGMVVTAGFWNSHVHILTPGLLHAEKLSSEQITTQLQEMLTRWGFTTVFDIASVLENTTLIRGYLRSESRSGARAERPFTSKDSSKQITSSFPTSNQLRRRQGECANRSVTARTPSKSLQIPSRRMAS